MALVSLLIGKLLGEKEKGTRINRTVEGKTSTIYLDATINETSSNKSTMTTHPVERRTSVSDHVILEPRELTIEGIITNTPFDTASQLSGLATSVVGRVGRNVLGTGPLSSGLQVAAGKTLSSLFGIGNDVRVSTAVKEFNLIREAKTPITIVTGLQTYTDFLLIGFQISRDKDTGNAVNVSLEFREIKFAESQIINIPIPAIQSALSSCPRPCLRIGTN